MPKDATKISVSSPRSYEAHNPHDHMECFVADEALMLSLSCISHTRIGFSLDALTDSTSKSSLHA